MEESVDGLLGIRTRGRKMVGAYETTELWRPPILEKVLPWEHSLQGHVSLHSLTGLHSVDVLRRTNNITFSCSIGSNSIKLETSWTIIRPPIVSVLDASMLILTQFFSFSHTLHILYSKTFSETKKKETWESSLKIDFCYDSRGSSREGFIRSWSPVFVLLKDIKTVYYCFN